MNTLILLRHSLTRANEEHLYCGWTDLPLSPAGEALATSRREEKPLPSCDYLVDSGLLRSKQTMFCLFGRKADQSLSDLREMNFGKFEMQSYEQLKDRPEYVAWIEDATGDAACPGGESRNRFRERVLRGGKALLALPHDRVAAVCHGGVIVNLMQAWFPDAPRNFYEWQPAACEGYRITAKEGVPIAFEEV